MRPRRLLPVMVAVAFALIISSPSCKKDDKKKTDNTTTQEDSTQLKQSATDDQDIIDATSAIDDDINTVLSVYNIKGDTLPCYITMKGTPDLANKKATFILSKTACGYQQFDKEGQVTFTTQNGKQWSDSGAVFTAVYSIYMTRKNTTRTVQVHGYRTITNVNGGLLKDLVIGKTITHKINAFDTIMYDKNTQRTTRHTMQKQWKLMNNTTTLTITGYGSEAGYTNLLNWGTNRAGQQFYGQVSQPVICNNTCLWVPSQGVKTQTLITATGTKVLTITLGVDAKGNPMTSGCPAYYKISWKGVGDAERTIIIAY